MATETFPELSFGSIHLSFETVILAIVVAVVGVIAARIIIAVFQRMLTRSSGLPELIIEFMVRFFSALLYVIVILLVLATLGIDVGSVVLGLSAIIGLVLGFGLQDTLKNFAAGIWVAALRPIDKGEYVEVDGMSGTVQAVGIMATELLTVDNKIITIPNAQVWDNPVINFTRMETRRADVSVGIGYDSDVEEAVKVAMDLMHSHPAVLSDPAPKVVITDLADSSVNLALWAWTKTGDMWQVKWDLTRDVLAAYRKAGIEIPFPQVDVHLER